MTDIDLTIRSGLPFTGRLIRVVDGKNIWPTLASFEVRAQMRKYPSSTSALQANLHDYMTSAYGVGVYANDIEITWTMDGAETQALNGDAGYYDVVISDPGAADVRGVVLFGGKIQFVDTVTKTSGTT